MATPLANKMAGVWCSIWKSRFQVDHPAQRNKGMFAIIARNLDSKILPMVGNVPGACVALMTWYINRRSARDMQKYAASVAKSFSLAWHIKSFHNEHNHNPNDEVFHHVEPAGPEALGEDALPKGFVDGMELVGDNRSDMIVIEPGSDVEYIVQPLLEASAGGCTDTG